MYIWSKSFSELLANLLNNFIYITIIIVEHCVK